MTSTIIIFLFLASGILKAAGSDEGSNRNVETVFQEFSGHYYFFKTSDNNFVMIYNFSGAKLLLIFPGYTKNSRIVSRKNKISCFPRCIWGC